MNPFSNLSSPELRPRKRWLPSLIWLVPLICALIGGALVVKSVAEKGPVVTVTFNNAEGMEAGKTKVKYKDVEIGSVQTITLSRRFAACHREHPVEQGRREIRDARHAVLGVSPARG